MCSWLSLEQQHGCSSMSVLFLLVQPRSSFEDTFLLSYGRIPKYAYRSLYCIGDYGIGIFGIEDVEDGIYSAEFSDVSLLGRIDNYFNVDGYEIINNNVNTNKCGNYSITYKNNTTQEIFEKKVYVKDEQELLSDKCYAENYQTIYSSNNRIISTKVVQSGTYTYISLKEEIREELTEKPEEEIILTPMGAKAKTYMDYRAITDTSSNQWKLLQTMTIGYDGMIRDADGYIAAALGSAFGPIGSRYVFTLEDGKELPIIKADQKQDRHTCDNNIFGLNNWDIIEFIVDSSKMPIYPNGYVYGGNFDNCPEYAGDVLCWEKVD